VPQVEVTFDIDANGIVNVSAKDKATGKEQKVTITASSGLSEAEIQQMVRDAELHADEDTKRREAIELRNQAETMAFQAEKVLQEHGDTVPAEVRADVAGKVAALRDVLDNDPESADRLRPAYEALTQALAQIGQHLYGQAGADGAAAEPVGAAAGTGARDAGTVEGEFREVKD
jgi:molecular chaperone DnaK